MLPTFKTRNDLAIAGITLISWRRTRINADYKHHVTAYEYNAAAKQPRIRDLISLLEQQLELINAAGGGGEEA